MWRVGVFFSSIITDSLIMDHRRAFALRSQFNFLLFNQFVSSCCWLEATNNIRCILKALISTLLTVSKVILLFLFIIVIITKEEIFLILLLFKTLLLRIFIIFFIITFCCSSHEPCFLFTSKSFSICSWLNRRFSNLLRRMLSQLLSLMMKFTH